MTIIDKIIQEINDLEPLSPTIPRLASILADEGSSLDDIVEIIKYDQAITAMVLRFANSSYSASNRKIETLRDAMIRIGSARVLSYCMGTVVAAQLKAEVPQYGYSENELWRHSIAATIAAEHLSSFTAISIGGISFTASLLHDIGKLILVRVVPFEHMEKVWTLLIKNPDEYTCEKAERTILGMSHAEVGARIAGKWKFPDCIINAIANHHSDSTENCTITDTVKIANFVAKSIGEGIGKEGMGFLMGTDIYNRIGIDRDALYKICIITTEKLEKILSFYE